MVAVLKSEDFTEVTQPRFNIYTVIHKGLRGFMTDTLHRWGRADTTDEGERSAAIEQVRALLELCYSHLRHENEFLHPAIEAARSGAAAQTAHDHEEHEAAITELRQQVTAVESAPEYRRAAVAQAFYLRLSAFVAENLEHMIVEETENHAVLAGAYSDGEVMAIEHRIVATLSPEESFTGLRWMIGHINAQERAFLLGGMKQGAPPEVFQAVMNLARELLSQRDFYKLELALA